MTPDQVVNELLHQRHASGYSQRELAKRAGIHYTTVGYIETKLNAPNLETLLKLITALNLTPSQFFKEIEDASVYNRTSSQTSPSSP